MPYASHRVVGFIELEPHCMFEELHSVRMSHSFSERATTATIHEIGSELAKSRSTPRFRFEPVVKIDSAILQRELEAELARLLAENVSAA